MIFKEVFRRRREGYASAQAPRMEVPHSGPPEAGRVTQLLRAAASGESGAVDEVFPLVYDWLRSEAARMLRGERAGHTLQPTALVHEAWIRLSNNGSVRLQDRAHFRAVVAMVMRRILVDHARRRGRQKRGGNGDGFEARMTLARMEASERSGTEFEVDLVALDDALTRLAELDARMSRTVELRYFGGLSVEETAETIGVGSATVKRDWTLAKVWLRRELDHDGAAGS